MSAVAEALALAREAGASRVVAQPLRGGTWLHLRGGPHRVRTRRARGFAASLAAELEAPACAEPLPRSRVLPTAFGPAVTLWPGPGLEHPSWRTLGLDPEHVAGMVEAVVSSGVVLVNGIGEDTRRPLVDALLQEWAARGHLVVSVERRPMRILAGVRQPLLGGDGGFWGPDVDGAVHSAVASEADVLFVGAREISHTTLRLLERQVQSGRQILREVPGLSPAGWVLGYTPRASDGTLGTPVSLLQARRLAAPCPWCRRPVSTPPGFAALAGFEGREVTEAPGCSRCAFTGHRGWAWIHEVLCFPRGLPLDVLGEASARPRGPTWREHLRRRLSRGEVGWRAAAVALADWLAY